MANKDQINELIQQLSQRLNTDTNQVEAALKKGNFDKVLEKMDKGKAEKIQRILSDPEQANKVLSSPQAQAIIKRLMG